MSAYWLMKSEPDNFSFDDLVRRGDQGEGWDGVRNYQARNFMRDMRVGDGVLFYHSSTAVPGIVGTAEVVREAYPDPTQFDPTSAYYDPRSSEDKPHWWQVDIRYISRFPEFLSLKVLREQAELADMVLLRKGNRLSVMPVAPEQWRYIIALGGLDD